MWLGPRGHAPLGTLVSECCFPGHPEGTPESRRVLGPSYALGAAPQPQCLFPGLRCACPVQPGPAARRRLLSPFAYSCDFPGRKFPASRWHRCSRGRPRRPVLPLIIWKGFLAWRSSRLSSSSHPAPRVWGDAGLEDDATPSEASGIWKAVFPWGCAVGSAGGRGRSRACGPLLRSLKLLPGKVGSRDGAGRRRLLRGRFRGHSPGGPRGCRIPTWGRPQDGEGYMVPVSLWLGDLSIRFSDGDTEAQGHPVMGTDAGGEATWPGNMVPKAPWMQSLPPDSLPLPLTCMLMRARSGNPGLHFYDGKRTL